jgi:hypothetical protein
MKDIMLFFLLENDLLVEKRKFFIIFNLNVYKLLNMYFRIQLFKSVFKNTNL